MDYLQLLNRLHVALQPAVYLEIGVQHGGESLSLSRSRSFAIDPAPQLRSEALVGKQWVKLYQQPSDDFFQTHTAAATLEGELLDLAFIAGSHEFVQVVRDLENVEQWSHPGTVAVIHDVLPRGAWEATQGFHPGAWTGDVWRIVPFLAEHRPDLSCHLVNGEPAGVLVVTGFDPGQRGMAETARALDAEFPPDGASYNRLVEAYLNTVRPESAEASEG